MVLPNARIVKIKEQVINDDVTGLMLVFRVVGNGEFRLHLVGSPLPFGNRDFQFSEDGDLIGTGTGLTICEKSNLE